MPTRCGDLTTSLRASPSEPARPRRARTPRVPISPPIWQSRFSTRRSRPWLYNYLRSMRCPRQPAPGPAGTGWPPKRGTYSPDVLFGLLSVPSTVRCTSDSRRLLRLVAGCDTGSSPVGAAEPDQVAATHDRDSAIPGMPADRDGHCLTLAPTKRLVHFFWHLGDAHGRRSHDAMMGDQSLFTSAAQVEQLWEISAPLLKHPPPVEPYPRGSWSSSSVDTMIAPHRWHLTRSIEVARRHPGTG